MSRPHPPGQPRQAADPQTAYHVALDLLHSGQGNPLAVLDRSLAVGPPLAAVLCLRAALCVMACREDAQIELERTLRAAEALPEGASSARERWHFAAASAWLDRDLQRALRTYGDIAAAHPHDTLALRVAHFGDLQWSRTEQLRDRVAAVLPHWHAGQPGYGHVLAMHAFGLAEAGEPIQAEHIGRLALTHEPHSTGAIHAVAHALEMQGRAAVGITWLHKTAPVWMRSPGYAVHLWWHLALHHLDQGDTAAALQIHDRHLCGPSRRDAAALVDASALLWRLQLLGLDVASRWALVADSWLAGRLGGLRPFNDAHAVLACVGAGRLAGARALLGELRAFALRTRDLEGAIQRAALPVCEALMAFGAGRYAQVVSGLLQARRQLQRCGGSRPQCDLLHLTLLEAALRSGQIELSQRLIDERLALRPRSQLNRRLGQRVRALSTRLSRPGEHPSPRRVQVA